MDDRFKKCIAFYEELERRLSNTHVSVGSCNRDLSSYLIPNGTKDQITYHSKPVNSFRISDHWNWKTNLKKCEDESYVQCLSKDLPWTKKRNGEGMASDPVRAKCVCFFGPDNLYHVIYGEKFDRKTKTWSWIESSVESVLQQIKMEAVL